MKAASFLTTCMAIPLSGIITSNYDLLIEYCLGTKGFNYGVQNQQLLGRGPYPVYVWNRGPVTLKGNIRLAKIHGSINNLVYTDGRRRLAGKALIYYLT